MEILELDAAGLRPFAAQLRELEARVHYPLGEDRFRIDHGRDYAAFFARLGEPRFYLLLRDGLIQALCAEVRRVVAGQQLRYLADLKAAPGSSVPSVARKLLAALRPPDPEECVYGISMDPPGGGDNRVIRLLLRLHPALQLGPRLCFFTLGGSVMQSLAPAVEALCGPLSYLSLRGCKDLILESTGLPMPLWHLQFGAAAPGAPLPQPEGQHMFCAPKGGQLDRLARAAGCVPMAAASTVFVGREPADWGFVRTSDI